MAGNGILGSNESHYTALLANFPPRVIRSEAQRAETWQQIDRLLSQSTLTEAEEDYLDLLSQLIADWEDEQEEPLPDASGVDMVRFLLGDRGLRQGALVPIFGSPSIVSEVLAGKRRLQAKHIAGLAQFFGVSPALFYPEPVHTSRRERD